MKGTSNSSRRRNPRWQKHLWTDLTTQMPRSVLDTFCDLCWIVSNILRIMPPERGEEPKIKAKDGEVFVHPVSVNFQEKRFNSESFWSIWRRWSQVRSTFEIAVWFHLLRAVWWQRSITPPIRSCVADGYRFLRTDVWLYCDESLEMSWTSCWNVRFKDRTKISRRLRERDECCESFVVVWAEACLQEDGYCVWWYGFERCNSSAKRENFNDVTPELEEGDCRKLSSTAASFVPSSVRMRSGNSTTSFCRAV